MKTYTQAPIPFMGQKRRFLKDFKEALKLYPHDAIFVDLFGGSGLLSHTVKRHYPNATVIYNDFDGYRDRIKAIPKTNKLLADIRSIVADAPKDKKIGNEKRKLILDRVKKEKGFVDYVTLSSSLLFSMNYVTNYEDFSKATFYNVVKHSGYNAEGYLDGLDIVSCDYRKLFEQYRSHPNVVFMVDPPYLSTEAGTYKGYWKLSDYLNVLDVLNGGRYFYFTSNKSHIVELCNWISTRTGWENPFAGAVTTTASVTMNYSSSYTDIMINKK